MSWWVGVWGLVRSRIVLAVILLATSVFYAPGGVGATAGSNTDPAYQSVSPSDVVLNGIASSASVYGPECDVTGSHYIGLGGSQDWSITNGLLVYSAQDARGIYQIYTSQPDGTEAKCVTCSYVRGGPLPNRNKSAPKWDPTGRYIVMDVEYDVHPLVFSNSDPFIQEGLINGVWTDIWIVSADGSHWQQLTYTHSRAALGVLDPVWSRDGKRLFWSEMLEGPSWRNQFGTWRLKLADVNFTNTGAYLSNVKDITPLGGRFFESHAFSPDGSSVIFTSDIDARHTWHPNIWSMNLASQELVQLSNSGYWNEHADYTPGGQRVTYMSTAPNPETLLQAPLLMMDANGGEITQLTHFNVAGAVEYVPYPVMITRASWNADGTQLVVTLQRGDTYPSREMWLLTFAGQCGI